MPVATAARSGSINARPSTGTSGNKARSAPRGGSPRKGARSEPASGAATGGGGPQAPPTRMRSQRTTSQAPATRTSSRPTCTTSRPTCTTSLAGFAVPAPGVDDGRRFGLAGGVGEDDAVVEVEQGLVFPQEDVGLLLGDELLDLAVELLALGLVVDPDRLVVEPIDLGILEPGLVLAAVGDPQVARGVRVDAGAPPGHGQVEIVRLAGAVEKRVEVLGDDLQFDTDVFELLLDDGRDLLALLVAWRAVVNAQFERVAVALAHASGGVDGPTGFVEQLARSRGVVGDVQHVRLIRP